LTIAIILGILLALILIILAYLRFNPQFGGQVTAADRAAYQQSLQWNGKIFVNQSKTEVDVSLSKIPGLIRANNKDRKQKVPSRPIPVLPFDAQRWNTSNAHFNFIWYGHSVCLMKLSGKNILIDPMFGPDASPVGPVRTKRFSEETLDIIDQLPDIDLLCLTHDHYDHLDYDSIQKLKGRVGHYYVALGVKKHLRRWGVPSEKITEFDWWDEQQVGGIHLTFTPSRHFSGRGLADRAKCLWGGWALRASDYSVYWSGDGGYDRHYKEVGEKLGPFDWAFMECGQYYKLWTQIHESPEEAVQAGVDAHAKIMTPVHWAGFKLAPHHWLDPIERFVDEIERRGLTGAYPQIGQMITNEDEIPQKRWWADYK
jgi:L-ascorbate metabolism protein UlaG (beta-lactamase superfamily)